MSGRGTPRRRGGPSSATSARRCCSAWTNPQQWLMLAMFLLALFIFGIRLQQAQNVRPSSLHTFTLQNGDRGSRHQAMGVKPIQDDVEVVEN